MSKDKIFVVFENDPDGLGKKPVCAYWSKKMALQLVSDPSSNKTVEAVPILDNFDSPKFIGDPINPKAPRWDPIDPINPGVTPPNFPPMTKIDPFNPKSNVKFGNTPDQGFNFKPKDNKFGGPNLF